MSDPAEVPTASPLLETVGLACERDWRMLFERLDLRLAAGEMLQVVGPNGSGKTSLLRLLSGLMQPTAGEVPASREAIWQALADVGLRGFEDVPCHTLSAGQQRRVALARLYLDAPPLWILDEPFTALDKQGVAQLETHLAGHCQRGGMVVLTTHHSLQQMPAGYRELDLGALKAASGATVEPALGDPA